jgi:hypothetical protein
MGSVWQSECVPEPDPENSRCHHRAPARHRKPSMWYRIIPARREMIVPVSAANHLRGSLSRLAPLGRWRLGFAGWRA